MGYMATTLHIPDRPETLAEAWTVDDLGALPNDGLRYELLDGTLIVSPSPVPRHQLASGAVYLLLAAACPPELRALFAPLDWQPTATRSFQPDLLVAPRASLNDLKLQGTPLLVVEILSPSSRTLDRVLKFSAYAEGGAAQYWIVDPGSTAAAPSVEVYDLEDGSYRLQGRAAGDETLAVHGPVEVDVTPAELIK